MTQASQPLATIRPRRLNTRPHPPRSQPAQCCFRLAWSCAKRGVPIESRQAKLKRGSTARAESERIGTEGGGEKWWQNKEMFILAEPAPYKMPAHLENQ